MSDFAFNCARRILKRRILGDLMGEELKLWYSKPARKWTQALPIGNGRLGAMVFGAVNEDILQLNEDTIWSGFPEDYNNDEASEHIDEVRQLIFEGKLKEAEKIVKDNMLGRFMQAYQPLGYLRIKNQELSIIHDYTRTLDLNNALIRVNYRTSNGTFRKEIFASNPDQCIMYKFERLSGNGLLNFDILLDSPHPCTISSFENRYSDIEIHGLRMAGAAPSYVDSYGRGNHQDRIEYEKDRSTKWETRVFCLKSDGSQEVTHDRIEIRNASSFIIGLVAASSFSGFNVNPILQDVNPRNLCKRQIKNVMYNSYEKLRERHIDDYSSLFNRVSINLGRTKVAELPTDKRISRLKRRFPHLKYFLNSIVSFIFKKQFKGLQVQFNKSSEDFDDPQLIALYFQFGRYLMISSSREGTQPANLQGIWNESVRPPWACNYTININAEMNYWPVEVCNLSECHEPLLKLIQELSINGKETAKQNYGVDGWCAHHNTTLWRNSTPADNNPVYAYWPMGGAWLSLHLWEHYAFTQNKEYLEDFAYPIMEGASKFCLNWLVKGPEGHLVTCPATSPENRYKLEDGTRLSVHYGSTCDLAIIRQNFINLLKASEILGIDNEFVKKVKDALDELYPYQIGRYGQLQEWVRDFDEPEPGHRHMSHLIGLHPGDHITPEDEPYFAEAAHESLIRRIRYGGGATGWSCAWKINLFARLKDNLNTYRSICTILQQSTYPNLFDAHPPFQIDGNFGASAGIAEMLLQSHNGIIEFLPALPKQLSKGSVRGLKARGNIEVDIYWGDNQLQKAKLRPKNDIKIKIRSKDKLMVTDPNGKSEKIESDEEKIYSFKAKAGLEYKIVRN